MPRETIYRGRLIPAPEGPSTFGGWRRTVEVDRGDGIVDELRPRGKAGGRWFDWGARVPETIETVWAVLMDGAGEDACDGVSFQLLHLFASFDPDQEWKLTATELRELLAEELPRVRAEEAAEAAGALGGEERPDV